VDLPRRSGAHTSTCLLWLFSLLTSLERHVDQPTFRGTHAQLTSMDSSQPAGKHAIVSGGYAEYDECQRNSEISPELQQRIANALLANLLKQNVQLTIRNGRGASLGPHDASVEIAEDDSSHEPIVVSAAPKTNGRNAGIVGLLGFGMTTILLNLHNCGAHSSLMTPVAAMGIVFGGTAQLIAGILEYFHGNNFGFLAFTSYGAFWLSLVGIWMLPVDNANAVSPATGPSVASFLLLWMLFTCCMFYCTFFKNVAMVVM